MIEQRCDEIDKISIETRAMMADIIAQQKKNSFFSLITLYLQIDTVSTITTQ